MVSYDIYKNRIQKIAAVKNFIVKFRILFISAICLILAATTAFLIMKGMVINGVSLPAQIIYGDTYEPEGGKALFSGISYEYALIESNSHTTAKSTAKKSVEEGAGLVWTTEKPDKAGTYYIRTVTQKSFGITGYGTPIKFEIQPRTVEFLILDEAVIYGSDPDEYSFKLVGNDKLVATGLKYDFASFEATVTNVCANAQSVKVVDGSGEDVTYCYDIVTPEKEVRLVERKITVTPANAEFVYDGSAVEYKSVASEETVRNLGEGDTIKITTVIKDNAGNVIDGTPVLAGTYSIEVDSVSIFKGEIDVTARYGITNAESQLIIGRRPLKITTSSASRDYNGKPLISTAFTPEGLVEGHFAEINSDEVNITFAGSIENRYTFAVTDGNTDLTENYDITYEYGTLSVQPKRITLNTPNAEKVYDGEELSLTEGYTLTELAEGDYEGLVTVTSITEVGSKANALLFIIYNEEGLDVTSSYSVNNVFGTLTVTPRPLKITTGSAQKVYDGKTLYGDGEEGLTFDNLVEGSEYRPYNVAEIIDAGSVVNDTKYRILSAGKETTSSYAITYDTGVLTVTKQALNVTTGSAEKVYDGTPLSGESAINGLVFDGIIDGESWTVSEASAITNVGEAQNKTTYKIFAGEKETTANYDIEYDFAGMLTVTVRYMTVTTSTSSHEYDGEPYSDFTVADVQGLVYGQSLQQFGDYATVTNVNQGEVQNEVYYIVKDADGEDVSENYDITYKYGMLNITPREINVVSSDGNWEYDGNAHFNYTCLAFRTDSSKVFVLNHKINFISYTDITDVGEATNIVEISIYNPDTEEDVTENYSINWGYGTLKVTPRAIIITTGTAEKVYDGTPLLGDGGDAIPQFENLAENQIAQVDFVDRMLNVLYEGGFVVGKDNKTTYKIYSGDIDTTANYAITYVYGELKITPRPVTITTHSAEKEYDGTPLYGDGGGAAPEFENLVQGEPWLISYTYSITEVTYNEELKLNKTQYTLGINNANYDITYIYGILNILPRKITVTTATEGWEYDGFAHRKTNGWVTSKEPVNFEWVESLLRGHTLIPDENKKIASVTNVNEGEVENEVHYTVSAADGRDVSHNYTIQYIYGKISVYPREIYVTTATANWLYDGEPHSNISCTAERLLTNLNHVLMLDGDKYTTVTNVYEGEVENRVEYKVFDWFEGGNDISYNYNIVYTYGTLSITPRAITVTTATDEWEYDGKAHFNNNFEVSRKDYEKPLVLDHEVKVLVGYTEITDVGTVDNVLNCIVVSATDDRVNENYEILYTYGTLTIFQRKITVTTATESWTYDGQEHFNNTVKDVTRLVLNHKVVVDEYTTITDVGEVENEFVCRVIDPDNAENIVNGNYTIEYINGTLTVSKRTITVTTADGEWEYDGITHSNTAYTKAENLLEKLGHTLEVDGENYATITDVDDVENKVEYLVKNSAGEDISGNYDIKYVYGNLSVYARAITVTTSTVKMTYNGYAQSRTTGWKADGLLTVDFNHTLVVDESKKIATVTEVLEGEVENEVHYFVHDAEGNDISGNYYITYDYGKISIKARIYAVYTATASREYDGTPFTKTDEYRLINTSSSLGILSNEPFLHTVVVDESKPIASVTDVIEGEVANKMFFKVLDKYGKDISYNYEYGNERPSVYDNPNHPLWGKISVTPRALTVTTGSAEKEYDAERLQKLDGFTADRLVLDHEVVLDYSRQDEFAFALNAFDGENKDGVVKNTLFFKVRPKDSEDEDINQRINANYDITVVAGTLTITKKAASITTLSYTKVYDGKPLTTLDFRDEIVFEGFITKENIFFIADGSEITEVGKIQNTVDIGVFENLDSGGAINITGNYNITYTYGTLEVTARPLTITTGTSLDKEYDGTPFKGEDAGATGDNLAEGQTLAVDTSRQAEFAWVTEVEKIDKENIVYYLVKDGDGNDVTANYEIEYEWGKINRTPRKIVITTGSLSETYDGKPHTCTDKNTADRLVGMVGSEIGAPVASHRVVVVPDSEITSITDVGSVDNVLICTVVRSDGTDVSHNYDITGYNYGTLTITPRPITITTGSAEKVYDGKALSDMSAEAVNLVKDHRLKATTSEVSIIDVDDVENYYLFEIYDGERDVTFNYAIEYSYGRLKITQRPITVVLNPTPDTVYGTPYTHYETGLDKFANVDTIDLAEGERLLIVGVDYYGLSGSATPKDVGTYKVVANMVISGGRGKISNYKVTQEESSFKITKLKITVTLTPQEGKEYDGLPYHFPQDAFTSTGTAYDEVLYVSVDYYTSSGIIAPATDADTYTIKLNIDSSIIYPNIPVTNNYEVESAGDIEYTISKRVITVTTGSDEKVYDGDALTCTEENSADRLVSGHSVAVKPNTKIASITYVEEVDNVLTCIVVNSDGKDVTHNYDITDYTYGKLKITPKPITVTVYDRVEEYTGKEILYGAYNYDRSGFVKDDADKAKFTYTYLNGDAKCTPVEKGEYKVSISFADDEFISTNYDITYVDGTLEIVSRRVTVSATAEDFEYDGKPLDISLLGFKHQHTTNLSEDGFLNGDENLYEVQYTVTSLNGEVVYNFGDIIYAGTYKVTVKLTPKDPANEDYFIDVYNYCSLVVEKRKITASVTLKTDNKEYDKKLPEADNFGYIDYRYGSEEAGFVNDDIKYAVAEYAFRQNNVDVQPINAGVYAVYVNGFTSSNGFIERNYSFNEYSEGASFEITKRLLIIAPVGKSELYEGQSISIDPDEYKLLGGSLADGDTLGNIVGSDVLTPTRPTAPVTIKSFTITDSVGDCANNYEVITAYNRNDERLKDCRISDFTAILRYEKRTFTVIQNVPQGSSSIKYEGVPITLTPDDGMFTVVQGEGDGLLAGNVVHAIAVRPFVRPGVYTSWLTVGIYDADGNNITWAYSVTYADMQSSYITVEEVALTINVLVDISGLEDGTIITDFELAGEGALLEGDLIELTVVGGKLTATVYTEYSVGTEVRRRDRSSYYKINFTGEYAAQNAHTEA